MLVTHFPPGERVRKLAVSLGIGLLVGIGREWCDKDLGIRTFAMIAVLGMMATWCEVCHGNHTIRP
jgi:uncharacterized membrane protein YhiD involved in acid resistance